MSDRRIHARYDGMQVILYDRAGKWYLEPLDARLPRQRVTIQDAVRMALWGVENANGVIYMSEPGGKTFERLVLSATASEES